jgi:hypothetical protein
MFVHNLTCWVLIFHATIMCRLNLTFKHWVKTLIRSAFSIRAALLYFRLCKYCTIRRYFIHPMPDVHGTGRHRLPTTPNKTRHFLVDSKDERWGRNKNHNSNLIALFSFGILTILLILLFYSSIRWRGLGIFFLPSCHLFHNFPVTNCRRAHKGELP